MRTRATRLAALSAIVFAALTAGCGSVATRAPETQSTAPGTRSTTPTRPGGYYQDDGPGDNAPANMASIPDAEPKLEPLHRFANNPYNALGQDYVPYRELRPYKERGIGSWYGRKFHGQRTSSGEAYDMYAMTAAHPVLPIPSYARVTNAANGRSVIVRINDRGPFRPGRIIDLSYTAAWKLGYTSAGSAVVEVESFTPGDIALYASRRAQAALAAAEVQPEGRAAGPAAGLAEVRANAPPPGPEARPLDDAPRAVAAAASAPAAAPAAPTVVAAIPVSNESGGIYLQLGAFSSRENAENFRSRISGSLSWLDRAIEIFQRDNLFRLHLGPYRDRGEAGGIADRIRDALDLKAVVVSR